ncbi:hypothetical protein [Lentibacillus sp. Marseille-P4043]|uniref:hypothetical protein n=1 Tax=Lentibacillus sp. Marseille-P4043 TaxID=2040293 RepID=UPI000D0B6CEA|nr:hypothetical protein [Lentibacillus sp. Marseille-P4043]
MSSEKQQNNVNELLKLIKENPDLDIVPMVDTDVVAGDDFGWWVAGWGSASIEEIYDHNERCYVRSKDEDEVGELIYDRLEMNNPAWSDTYLQEQTDKELKEIEWDKVIAVKISVP